MLKKLYLLLPATMIVIAAQGQKIAYRQLLSNPSHAFPELTGWHGALQVNGAYRVQYPGSPATTVSYAANVDGYVHKLRSGIGLNVSHDRVGTGITNFTELDLNIAPKIRLTNNIVLMPAISMQYFQIAVDFSQLAPNGFAYSPDPAPVSNSIHVLTGGAGLGIAFNETFIVAHSDYITQPNVSFFANREDRLSGIYKFLAGRNFKLGQLLLTPNVSYQRYEEFNFFSLGMNAGYKWFYLGGQYVHNQSLVLGMGYELMQRFRVSYSYEHIYSTLGIQSIAAHEVALRIWLFKDKAKTQFLKNLPLM